MGNSFNLKAIPLNSLEAFLKVFSTLSRYFRNFNTQLLCLWTLDNEGNFWEYVTLTSSLFTYSSA